jgi:sirohydrochlorin cobaltochelatase
MPGGDFSDAALIILGHGSTIDSEAGAPVYQHAGELRQRGGFGTVHEAFWKQEPRVDQVLADAKAARVFIVPLFISEGYFAQEVIPRALGFFGTDEDRFRPVIVRGDRRIQYCRPVGTHDGMSGIILDRARDIVERFPFPRPPPSKSTTLFVAGHGTDQNPNSRVAIEAQADRIAATGVYASVRAVFLDEEPRISSCYELALTKNAVVVPFFISEGPHVREDIPVMLGEQRRVVEKRLQNGQGTWRNPTERRGKRVWLSNSVGTHTGVADVIVERAREMAPLPS